METGYGYGYIYREVFVIMGIFDMYYAVPLYQSEYSWLWYILLRDHGYIGKEDSSLPI